MILIKACPGGADETDVPHTAPPLMNPAFALPAGPPPTKAGGRISTPSPAYDLPQSSVELMEVANPAFALPPGPPSDWPEGYTASGSSQRRRAVRFSEALAVKSVARVADLVSSGDESTAEEEESGSEDTHMMDGTTHRESSVEVPESITDGESGGDEGTESDSSDSSLEVVSLAISCFFSPAHEY